ncbi:MAG: hypothetical protein JXB48_23680 [Candidatus Latescibacteria bacterium]|nr:hypothetical protein [Candidatus Latescibacterota bacterium]
MGKDYFSPYHKRVVLKSGCIYGADIYLFELNYKKLFTKTKRIISSVIKNSNEKEQLFHQLEQRHNKLLSYSVDKAKIVYDKRNEVISINDKYITRYAPARILNKIVNAYIFSGKQDFEYFEFKNDPDIALDSYKPNIDIRINRISEKLRNEFPLMSITRTGKGKISFDSNYEIDYRER